MARYIKFVLNNRLQVALLLGLVTVFSIYAISQASLGTSFGEQLLGGQPGYSEYLELIDEFGNDEVIIVGVRDPDFLTDQGQKRLRMASDRIESLPFVARVSTVLDAMEISSDGDTLTVSKYSDEVVGRPERIKEAIDSIMKDDFSSGLLLSTDGTKIAIIVELEVDPLRPMEESPRFVEEILLQITESGYGREELHSAGFLVAAAESMREMEFNTTTLFPTVALILLLVVWLLFGRFWPAMLSLFVSIIAVIWMGGFLTLISPKIHALVSISPPVMLVVAFSDVVHLVSAYLTNIGTGGSKEEAISSSSTEVGTACMWTSATTFVGFSSIAFSSDNTSQQLGLALGFGVAAALFVAVTITPILFSIMPRPRALRKGHTARIHARLDRLLDMTRGLGLGHPKKIVFLFGILATFGLAGLAFVDLDADFSKRFDESNSLTIDSKWFAENFSGTNTVELYVSDPEGGTVIRHEILRAVMDLQKDAEGLLSVDSAVSVVDLVKDIHAVMDRDSVSDLPRNPNLLAQYLLLFESSDEGGLDGLMDFDRKTLRVAVRVNDGGARAIAKAGNDILQLASDRYPEISVKASGLVFVLGNAFERILGGQIIGLMVTFALITLMMIIGLRSVRTGVLSMIPNLLPVLTIWGVVGFFMGQVDSDVIIVLLIAIGIGVDDTIHFTMRYRIENDSGSEEPLRRTFAFSGRAIIMTTIILVFGFLPCSSTGFVTTRMLGTLLPLALIVALLSDLLLVTAMIRLGWMFPGRKSS